MTVSNPPQASKRRLLGLSSLVYEHPSDRAFLNAVKLVPGVDMLVTNSINHMTHQHTVRLKAHAIEVTPNAMRSVYQSFEEACDVLRMDVRPKLFIEHGAGQVNAYTTGSAAPIVVATDMAVEHFEPDEFQFVLGHELGHIKAGHVKYHALAHMLHRAADVVSSWTLGIGGMATSATLGATLFAWSRRSEFTADRAGLLACQNRSAAIRAMMKLAGFPPKLIHEMNPDEYLAQAQRHQKQLDDSFLDRLDDLGDHLNMTHPLLTARASEIASWIDDGFYDDIVEADESYLRAMSEWISNDPQEQLLLHAAIRTLSAWAVTQFSVSHSQAARIIRRMLHAHMAPAHTPLERILRVELHVQRVGSDNIQYRLAVLVHQSGKAMRHSFDVPFAPAWSETPAELRGQFTRAASDSIVRLLYTVS